jgi:hypothetical protein
MTPATTQVEALLRLQRERQLMARHGGADFVSGELPLGLRQEAGIDPPETWWSRLRSHILAG